MEEAEHKSRRRWLKRSLLVVSLTFVLLIGALAGLYFALRSPAFYQRALPTVNSALASSGIEVQQLGSVQFDLLESLELRDVHLRWQDPEQGFAQITVGHLRLTYASAAVWSGQLQIDELSVQDVSVVATLSAAAPHGAAPAESAPLDWQSLGNLLAAPPLPLRIRAARLANIAVDLRQHMDSREQRLQGRIHNAAAELLWQPALIQGRASVEVAPSEQATWIVTAARAEETLELSAAPRLGAELTWELQQRDGAWQLSAANWQQTLALEQPQLRRQRSGEIAALGKLAAFSVSTRADAKSVAQQPGRSGLAAVFPLQLDLNMDTATSGLDLAAVPVSEWTVDARADHRLQVNLQGEVDPAATTPPRLAVRAEQTLTIDHLAATATATATAAAQRLSAEGFVWQLSAHGETPLDAALQMPVPIALDVRSHAAQVSVAARENAAAAQAVNIALVPSFEMHANAQLHGLADISNTLVLHALPEFHAEQVAVQLGSGAEAQRISVRRQALRSEIKLQQAQLHAEAQASLDDVLVPQARKPFALRSHATLDSDLRGAQPAASWQLSVDDQSLVQATVRAHNGDSRLLVNHEVSAELPAELARKFPALADLVRLGGALAVVGTGETVVQHGAAAVQAADAARWDRWPLQTNGQVLVTQKRPPRDADAVTLRGPLDLHYRLEKAQQYRAQVTLNTPGLQVAPLSKPLDLRLRNESRFDWPLTQLTSAGELSLAGTSAVKYDVTLSDAPHKFTLDSRWSLNANPQWQAYWAALRELDAVGQLQTQMTVNAEVSHPADSILQADPGNLAALAAKLTVDARVGQDAGQRGTLLILSEPLSLQQQVAWSGELVTADGRFAIPAAQVPEQLSLQALAGRFRLRAQMHGAAQRGELDLKVEKGRVQALTKTPLSDGIVIGDQLMPLQLTVTASADESQILLQQLQLQAGEDLLSLQASGAASRDGNNAQVENLLRLKLRPELVVEPAISGQGSVELPLRLTRVNGDRYSLDGEVRFNDLGLTIEQFRIDGLRGSIKVEEELRRVGEAFEFRYLVHADPFQRLDFNRLQPYLDDRGAMSVERLAAAGYQVGPALASVLLKQNLFRVQQLDLDLFGGHLTGQVYVDAQPGAWKIGLLSRMTQIDPRQLVAEDSPQRHAEYAPITARSALEFDVAKRLLQGRLDVTQISRAQLLQLLDVVDPQYQNEQVARVRAALRVAYPQNVKVDMRQGLMDLEVAISALPKPLQIRGVPLTPLIQTFAGPALNALDQLPLQ